MIDKLSLDYKLDYDRLGYRLNSNFSYLFNLEETINKPYNYVFGYFEDNKLLGFIHIVLTVDEADLINIVVDSLYQHKKIGTKLIYYVIKRFDLKALTLEVRESNDAVKFYEHLGFEIKRTIPKYYGNESAYLMKKVI
jgi:ribosomal-protein-alanine N-acetyltransferase